MFSYNIKNSLMSALAYLKAFFYWLTLGIVVGIPCGLCGALFAHAITFVTGVRTENSFLLFLLPIGGIISVALYKLCHVEGYGTNQVFECARSEKPVPLALMPAIFIGSSLTHLLGGSAGKEGAALQLGGSISSLISKIFKLDENSRHILTLCGMGALFSAVFGTPIGACVFALEVVRVGNFCSAAFFPTMVSSVTAFGISSLLKVEPERFHLSFIPEFAPAPLLSVLLIAIAGALVSVIFCELLHIGEKTFRRFFKNPFVRVVAGALIIIALTLILGTRDYNGSGVSVIHGLFTGESVKYEAFILKMIFTAITVGCGFKGGEIVPTLFIGATMGATVSALLSFDGAFGAAVGMAALFAGVTNTPVATIFICAEMFGGEGIIFFAMASVTSFLLSGMTGLYSSQKFTYSKLKEDLISEE